MSKLIKFGEDVKGFDVPVLNEREIRAAAGIMFLAIIISLMLILVRQDFFLKGIFMASRGSSWYSLALLPQF